MSSSARRLLAQSPINARVWSDSNKIFLQYLRGRPFTDTSQRRARDNGPLTSSPRTATYKPAGTRPIEPSSSTADTNSTSVLSKLANIFESSTTQQANQRQDPFLDITRFTSIGDQSLVEDDRFEEPHHFHVYSTKHNTHITLTRPNGEPIMSHSAGNIGFRKGARKHYDSAFQLAGYIMGRIQEQGINAQIKRLEVSLRGFGAGREAVTKAFLGNEGRFLRGKVVKVTDATRIKFGGTRSKKPRRLG